MFTGGFDSASLQKILAAHLSQRQEAICSKRDSRHSVRDRGGCEHEEQYIFFFLEKCSLITYGFIFEINLAGNV